MSEQISDNIDIKGELKHIKQFIYHHYTTRVTEYSASAMQSCDRLEHALEHNTLMIDKEMAEALYRYFHTSAGFIHQNKHAMVHRFVAKLAGFLKKDEGKPYDKNRRVP